MKRAPIVEDWSRFNQAVLEVADGFPQSVARKQPVPQQPKREPTELVSESGADGDTYGLIARHKWRKHA
jgi:hypothetical protein